MPLDPCKVRLWIGNFLLRAEIGYKYSYHWDATLRHMPAVCVYTVMLRS